MELIKPCPFCDSDNVGVCADENDYFFVECLDCYGRTGYCSTKERAIKKWNRRADDGEKMR